MTTDTHHGALATLSRLRGRAATVGAFLWHLLQMVLAMEAGMALYHLLAGVALKGSAFAALVAGHPLLDYWAMAVSMALPMVALMRAYHKSSWRACAEMTLAMFVPPAALTALVLSALLPLQTLQAWGDPLMILAMAADLLYRRGEHGNSCH